MKMVLKLSATESSANPSIASDQTHAEKLWYQLIITNSFDYTDELRSNNKVVQQWVMFRIRFSLCFMYMWFIMYSLSQLRSFILLRICT